MSTQYTINHPLQMDVLLSQETDPAVNLAIEESLYRRRSGDSAIMLLYRNAPSIIIGRNQNPWQECDVHWAQQHRIPILRRISGGGTVYHDLGNLNVSFIVPRAAYVPEHFMGLALAALAHLGIPSRLCSRRAVWVGDRKVAGSAFTLTGASALLHQCLLVNADLQALSRALKAPPRRLVGKSVSSVSSPVCTLTQQAPGITWETVRDALLRAAAAAWSVQRPAWLSAADLPDAPLQERISQYRSWDWTFARTAEFSHIIEAENQAALTLEVQHARIHHACARLPAHTPRVLSQLQGLDYDGPLIADCLHQALKHGLDGAPLAALIPAVQREIPRRSR